MLFNSIDFAIFLPIVFIIYWFFTNKNLKIQNILLLTASYVFYGWWNWRFLSLIMLSSFVDYFVGIGLSKTHHPFKRKRLLLLSIIVNIGILGIFKYYNFFVTNFIFAFKYFGITFNPKTINIILPVGISFYTFQTLSYSLDVYKNKIKPTRDIIAFFAFVSFFPQLVAGPIERASNLLPQFFKRRHFNYANAMDGTRQILWGLFKKMVIADNCAVIVNSTFSNYNNLSGSSLFLGVFFFAFQIYADFSGYSDIAIGTARLFGFNLMRNFAFPYFSRDIAEFWRRWHISLTTWFRDYIYIPLGGSRVNKWRIIRNVFIIFLISGFWHGANWTFIVWGIINAVFFIPLLLLNKNRNNIAIVANNKTLPNIREFLGILLTFFITLFAWVFFRSITVTDAIHYLYRMFFHGFFTIPQQGKWVALRLFFFIIILLSFEWKNRKREHGLEISYLPQWKEFIVLGFVFIIIFYFHSFQGSDFIYFQF